MWFSILKHDDATARQRAIVDALPTGRRVLLARLAERLAGHPAFGMLTGPSLRQAIQRELNRAPLIAYIGQHRKPMPAGYVIEIEQRKSPVVEFVPVEIPDGGNSASVVEEILFSFLTWQYDRGAALHQWLCQRVPPEA